MIIGLVAVGLFVGAISGFFGVGGGMILVPMLITMGIDIKSAIGISVVQMVFSSVYGSYLNYRKGLLQLNEGIWVGIGGLLGGVVGARFTDLLSRQTLSYIFLALVLFAIIQILLGKKRHPDQEEGRFSSGLLLAIGFGIGIIAMMLGVGGSIMLTPILVGFLHFPTKKAATAGLFFVVFSSLSGLGYKLYAGSFDHLSLGLAEAMAVSLAAIFGVIVGIKLKDIVADTHHRRSLIILYFVILMMLIKKIFFTSL